MKQGTHISAHEAPPAQSLPEEEEAPAVPLSPMDQAIPPQRRWRRYLPYALAGAVVLWIAAWLIFAGSSRAYRIPASRVTVGSVSKGSFEDFVAVRAIASPRTTHYLTAEQGGSVKEVLAEDGAQVSAGQALVVLTNAPLALQVASREADTAAQMNSLQDTRLQLEVSRFKHQEELLEIEHRISQLEGNLARDKILLDGKAIAPATYAQEQAEYAYLKDLRNATIASSNAQDRVRKGQLAQLEQTLQRLKDNVATAKASLDALTIRAPISGRLTALDAQVGQNKTQGAVIGQVDSPDQFKLTAQIDEFHLGRIVAGQRAFFSRDGREYQATVAKIYPQVANGTFRVDLLFAGEAPPGLQAGQAVDVRLELGGASQAMLLPNGPFYQDTGGRWVFVVGPDNKQAIRREVRLGRRNPQYIEVIEGLQRGEKVIVSGYQSFAKFDRIELDAGAADQ